MSSGFQRAEQHENARKISVSDQRMTIDKVAKTWQRCSGISTDAFHSRNNSKIYALFVDW